MSECNPLTEAFAEQHADQWVGCIQCKESHHETGFCQRCGQCFHALIGVRDAKGRRLVDNSDAGTFVHCPCGSVIMWD